MHLVFSQSVCVHICVCECLYLLCFEMSSKTQAVGPCQLCTHYLPKWFAYFFKGLSSKESSVEGNGMQFLSAQTVCFYAALSCARFYTYCFYCIADTKDKWVLKGNTVLHFHIYGFVSSTSKKVNCNGSRSDIRM